MSLSRRIAVLVGTCTYPNFKEDDLPTLTTPRNDIKALERVLREPARGNFSEVLTLEDAESGVVRDRIEGLLSEASQPNTLALIYYSGHGLLDPQNALHLALHDTQPGRWSRTLPISTISKWISAHSPRQLVIFLDCCYSGAGIKDLGDLEFKGTPSVNNMLPEMLSHNLEQLQGSGVVMITATTPIQQASADKTTGFGVFTKHLLEGLETASARRGRKRVVTVRDLYTYVDRKMRSAPGCFQTPMMLGAQTGGDFVLAGTDLLGQNTKAQKVRYAELRKERKPILDLVGPSYILDERFHFLDWNASFEHFVARPLGLRRRDHVGTFLEKLQNYDAIEKRSNALFRPNWVPPVDIEDLEYESKEYGLIVFKKIATQIVGPSAKVIAWCINLNISSVQRASRFWSKMEENLKRDLNWSKYAMSYDRIIAEFPEYRSLVSALLDMVGDSKTCLDLGAGTGTVTFELLKRDPQRRVVAIEKNEAMLNCFQRKINAIADERLKQRAALYKGDITTCLRQEKDRSFDACVMLNVLFALSYPQEVLQEVFRVLRPGGILSLSTSHKETDVNTLFAEIKRSLLRKDGWDAQTENAWKDAFERNVEMNDMITRHTLEEVKSYIVDAGFSIETFKPGHYVDCVVIVKAIKG